MKFKGGRAEGKAAIIGLSCRLPKSDNLEVFNSTAEDFKVTTNMHLICHNWSMTKYASECTGGEGVSNFKFPEYL
jgi:acyl transferase domain-containing protein